MVLTGVLVTKNRRGVYLEKALEDKAGEGETLKGSQRLNFRTSYWRLLVTKIFSIFEKYHNLCEKYHKVARTVKFEASKG